MSGHEGKARKVRGDEIRTPLRKDDADREGATSRASEQSSGVSFGAAGTDSEGTVIGFALLGGIIGQLIEQCEERLSEAKECVNWYTREVERVEKRLTELKELEELAQQAEKE